ncbi:MAG: SDR family oxidoreductase [Pseudomonadota bacterium]
MGSGVYVITGGSRGIGAACVKRAVATGHDVCFSYVSNIDAANDLVAQLADSPAKVKAVQADVASESDVFALYAEAETMGTITGLVNNAGVVDVSQRVEEFTVERLQRMFSINVIGSIICAREAVKRMSTRHGGNGGSIVNLGSAAAYIGSPGQYVDYASSKAAIDTFTKGLALEVAEEGIRVNAVRPGLIHTDIHESGGQPGRVEKLQHMVPMKRGGTAEEIANAVMWLMSDEASYVTGDSLNVTGGR